ncbi:WD40-repeat-containing domain protein [Scenedesmus sp. NREL 46B-D3]|nr:WD40-repeat-containing domain protein [Scenedesmus sp. NREL 46B-D3]
MPPKYTHTNTIKEHHGKPIFCVTFNTYDPANQDLVASVGGHQATVYRCHAHGRIEVLQVYVDDHTRRLNDEPKGEEEEFFCCKWTIDRASHAPLLLLAGKLALLRVVNCSTNTAVQTLKGHGKEVNDISVHQQHPHLILTASKDHSIRLWNIATGCCVLLMRGPGAHAGEVFTLDFHPWDPFLFVSGAMEGAVKVWSLKEHWSAIAASEVWSEPPQRRAFPVRLVPHPVFSSRHVHSNYVDCCRWLGDLVLSKSVDYKIKLWRPLYPDNPILETSSKFEVLQVFEQPGDIKLLWWVRFSIDPRGQVLVCGNPNGRTYVWEPGTGRPHRGTLLAHRQCTTVVRQTAVSMDASMIICSTDDGQLWRWDRQGPLTQQQTAQTAQQHATSSRRISRQRQVHSGGHAAVTSVMVSRNRNSSRSRGMGKVLMAAAQKERVAVPNKRLQYRRQQQ